jgi:hypothetical protein
METIMKNYLINAYLCELFSRFLSAGLVLFLFSGNLFAGGANLAWDASTSSSVGGYIVAYGLSSGTYTSNIDVGKTTTYAVSGLTDGTKYYFAVKAYDSGRTTESSYSNEANLTVPVTTTSSSTLPDVVVTSLSYANGVFTSTVKNQGTAATPAGVTIGVGYIVDGSGKTWGAISGPLAAGVSVTIGTNGESYTIPGGTLTMTAYVDDVNRFAESNETNNKLTQSITIGTTPAPAPAPAPAPDPAPATGTSNVGLVAAYGFEENSGTTVTDASGNANNGTNINATRITTGKNGKALNFNGTNAMVSVNNSASLQLTTGMTLEAWVKPSVVTSAWRDVIYKGNDNYFLMATSDRSSMPVGGGTFGEVNGTAALEVGTWTHLAVTYDGATQKLFVNGVHKSSVARTGTIATSTNPLQIGGDSIWGQFFQGDIDEVRIYNRALTQPEIQTDLATAVGAVSGANPLKFIMGDTNLEPLADVKIMGRALAFQVVPTVSGSVTQVMVYWDPSATFATTATQLVAGVYTNRIDTASINHAGTLIAQGTLSTLNAGWNSVTIPAAAVTAGQPYWLAILGPDGQIGYRAGSGTGLLEKSYSRTLTSLPATWTGSTSEYETNAAMSIYGNGN